MKRTLIVTAITAIFLSSGGPAFAQSRGDRDGNRDSNDRGRNEQMQGRGQQSQNSNDRGRDERMQGMQRNGQYDQRGNQARQPQRRDEYRGRAQNDHRYEGRGAGPNHAFYRGQRMPSEYRQRQYVVSDWRGHHLSAPPRGYHWVQSGADYVLVAIATGVILQLLLSN